MKGLLVALMSPVFICSMALPAPAQETGAKEAKAIVHEIEQTLFQYRSWLDSPSIVRVVKGTNHAARAVVLIDAYLDEFAKDEPEKAGANARVGIRGIRSLLMKQMRIHVELLSTTVPVGIVEYQSSIENTLEEQLNLLEQTLREFERHQSRS